MKRGLVTPRGIAGRKVIVVPVDEPTREARRCNSQLFLRTFNAHYRLPQTVPEDGLRACSGKKDFLGGLQDRPAGSGENIPPLFVPVDQTSRQKCWATVGR